MVGLVGGVGDLVNVKGDFEAGRVRRGGGDGLVQGQVHRPDAAEKFTNPEIHLGGVPGFKAGLCYGIVRIRIRKLNNTASQV